MDLLLLPFVVLIEVFKHVDFREKFLISLLSKRARSMLKLTSVKPHFSISHTNDLYIHAGKYIFGSRVIVTEVSEYFIEGETMKMSLSSEGVTLREESPEKQLLLINYLLDTFKNPSISVQIFDSTLPATVLDFMKIINQKKLWIKSFTYINTTRSSEFLARILDECTKVTDLIWIYSFVPDADVYTPPSPFKAKELRVGFTANWLNLESFMSCPNIFLEAGTNLTRTPQSWNTFFRKWIDSDATLEHLSCDFIQISQFPMMVDGLSNAGIQQRGTNEWIEGKRRDGLEFVIGRTGKYLHVMTKQAHLEHLQSF
uniref:F-box domain-containing protein n=1 Tax=Caenorhabditis tropicalis TaxID=1561998 RepID=A0A1I7UTK8_9PELO